MFVPTHLLFTREWAYCSDLVTNPPLSEAQNFSFQVLDANPLFFNMLLFDIEKGFTTQLLCLDTSARD